MSIAVIEVNRQAIVHNVEYIRKIAPNSQLVATIKANAYSHGIVGIAELLQNKVDYFFVLLQKHLHKCISLILQYNSLV